MYKIVGADQKEYGPVTEDQVRQWISEGRANAQTIVRFGEGPWKPLSTFPEFAAALGMPAQTGGIPPLTLPPVTGPGFGGGSIAPASNGMAIAGLSCAILGLFCCGPIFSTLGLIFSTLALSQINQNPGKYSGKGVAMAGLAVAVAGYVIFAILLFSGTLQRLMKRFSGYN